MYADSDIHIIYIYVYIYTHMYITSTKSLYCPAVGRNVASICKGRTLDGVAAKPRESWNVTLGC